jgi:hypothetical protein
LVSVAVGFGGMNRDRNPGLVSASKGFGEGWEKFADRPVSGVGMSVALFILEV